MHYVEHLLPANRFLHSLFRIVQSCVPSMQKKDKAELSTGVLLKCFLYGDEILEALGHFTALNSQMASMEKVRDPLVVIVASLIR